MSPNSFFQPFSKISSALFAVEKMVSAGASIIDVGGEATNPDIDINIDQPSVQVQLDRVLPLIEAITQNFAVLISVDTSCPQVMRAAIHHGADIINDQRALQVTGALDCIAELSVPVCLMHSLYNVRKPESCSRKALLQQVKQDLNTRINLCLEKGIAREKIIIDPGFGTGNYGKNSSENFYLLAHLSEIVALGFPVLVGWSRKSMIGEALGNVPPNLRLFGSIAAATIAAANGAAILRVHDVQETMDAVKIFHYLQRSSVEL